MSKKFHSWPTRYTALVLVGLTGGIFFGSQALTHIKNSYTQNDYQLLLAWSAFFILLSLYGATMDFLKRSQIC